MGRKAHIKEHVWNYIKRAGEDECWEWQLSKSPGGYGEFSIKHKRHRAHRVVFELANPGVSLEKIKMFSRDTPIVLHSCDNPSCCNPKHLYLGTPKENTQDMIRKGRRFDNKGTKHPLAKLTAEQVRAIRESHSAGIQRAALARTYGMSFAAIHAIVKRDSYKDIE